MKYLHSPASNTLLTQHYKTAFHHKLGVLKPTLLNMVSKVSTRFYQIIQVEVPLKKNFQSTTEKVIGFYISCLPYFYTGNFSETDITTS